MTDEPTCGLPADELLDSIGFQIGRLGKLRDRTTAQIVAASHGEIEPAAFSILFQLLQAGPMRSGALAEAMYSDASTISRQVAALVKRGVLERRADPDDGRVSVLAVTDFGREVAAKMRVRRNEGLRMILSDWTAEERDLFAGLLRRFVDGYEITRQHLLTELTENPPFDRKTDNESKTDTAESNS
ncbi:MarR family winged helix-turn-helix transcriptional regulator [Nocardia huaxiensis]|uniref:MarR family transcriptional regulator n=1 Tax=Nocardia huaxiensis TaxID=2755382 RepID=A0A7D6ZG65_9NOCA|nr:MarR family transcriptional regulator [Nocardia huaxiensis]QLY32938.1 MarR family transcriptional regulator [Nocardia huaxiensis]UFS93298.1 MarR family transcriptional regulator [Nocardia huaxiensis]